MLIVLPLLTAISNYNFIQNQRRQMSLVSYQVIIQEGSQ